jgi:hypothetical protein
MGLNIPVLEYILWLPALIIQHHQYMNEDTNNNQNSQDADYRRRNRHYYGRVYPGIWLLLVGLIFLLSNFGFFHGNTWGKLWPLFIIIPGLFMLLRPRRY